MRAIWWSFFFFFISKSIVICYFPRASSSCVFSLHLLAVSSSSSPRWTDTGTSGKPAPAYTYIIIGRSSLRVVTPATSRFPTAYVWRIRKKSITFMRDATNYYNIVCTWGEEPCLVCRLWPFPVRSVSEIYHTRSYICILTYVVYYIYTYIFNHRPPHSRRSFSTRPPTRHYVPYNTTMVKSALCVKPFERAAHLHLCSVGEKKKTTKVMTRSRPCREGLTQERVFRVVATLDRQSMPLYVVWK